MPVHNERRVMPYSPEQMYLLVSDVERYPDFLPWCLELNLRHPMEQTVVTAHSREQTTQNIDVQLIEADMTIGYKALRERFTSRVALVPMRQIKVEYLDGPFRYLRNSWNFLPHPEGCEVVFHIDFEFRSRVLRLVMGAFFHEAVRIMVRAFEKRARQLYR